jgi:hypothetical protein
MSACLNICLVSLSDRYFAQTPVFFPGLIKPSVKVVDENSATIPGKPYNGGLEADYRGINKFESNADPNYVKVLEKLKRLVDL